MSGVFGNIYKLVSAKTENKRLRSEIKVLKAAIRKHRDAVGHDRCWLNDAELYAALGEGVDKQPMPERDEFLKRCAEYHAQQTGGELIQ